MYISTNKKDKIVKSEFLGGESVGPLIFSIFVIAEILPVP